MKQKQKNKILFLLFSLVYSFSEAQVESWPLHFQFPRDQKAVDQLLVELVQGPLAEGLAIDESLESLALVDPVPMTLSQIRMRGMVRGRVQQDSRGPLLEAYFENPSVDVSLLQINTVLRRTLAGVEANLRLNATCSNIHIEWPLDKIGLFARFQFKAREAWPNLEVSTLSFSVPTSPPNIRMQCQGPTGIETVLRDSVLKLLQERWADSKFADLIARSLEKRWQSLATSSNGVEIFSGRRSQVRVVIEGQQGSRVLARVELLGADVSKGLILPRKPSSEAFPSDQFSATISLDFIERLAQRELHPSVWSAIVQGSTVAGFRDLMRSRFLQWVLFPDLLTFPKDTPFQFQFAMSEEPVGVRCVSTSRQEPSRVRLALPLRSWLQVPSSSQPADSNAFNSLVLFRLGVEADLIWGKNFTGQTAIATQIERIGMSYQFDPHYVATKNPNTRIAKRLILPHLKSAANGLRVEEMPGAIGQMAKHLERFDTSCDADSQFMTFIKRPQ